MQRSIMQEPYTQTIQYEYVPTSDKDILNNLSSSLQKLSEHGFRIIVRAELNEIRVVKGRQSYTIANNIPIRNL